MAEQQCPTCNAALTFIPDASGPTYPVYTDVKPVNEWLCPRCLAVYVAHEGRLQRAGAVIAQLRHSGIVR